MGEIIAYGTAYNGGENHSKTKAENGNHGKPAAAQRRSGNLRGTHYDGAGTLSEYVGSEARCDDDSARAEGRPRSCEEGDDPAARKGEIANRAATIGDEDSLQD